MKMSMDDTVSSDAEFVDSDEELQEAFARGDLKPGLVVLGKSGENSKKEKPVVINNVPMLEHKLEQIKLSKKLPWVERLDIINGLAPLAPEIALQMDDHRTKREREIKFINAQRKGKKSVSMVPQPSLKSVDEDPIHNDFVREMNFYRQGQEAILKCLPRLQELGVPTKRPDDYFAEMAKSDTHMHKVAKVLQKKQIATERAEKVRKIRQQKKISKQTQVHVLQERQKAKKDLAESVKQYRKGQKNALDFLDEKKGGRRNPPAKGNKPLVNRRREMKNERYGNGGQRKGSKWNTRESLDDYDGGKGFNKGKGGRGAMMGRGGRGAPMGRGGRGASMGRGGRGAPMGRGGRGASMGRGGRGSSMGRGGRGGSTAGSFGKRSGPGGNRPGKTTRQKIKARN